MGQVESKEGGAAVCGTFGGGAVVGGIALMFTGPVGWAVGGVLIGAGVSSTVNTVEQCINEKTETFDLGAWGKNVGIGAASGVIAAPFAAVGGAAAAGITSTAGKVATIVAAEAVGGAVSGGSTSLVAKAADGEDVSAEDFFKGALVGGAAGIVGGLAGQGAQRGASALTKGITKGAGKAVGKAIKIGTGIAGGASGGAGGAAIGKILENVLYEGKLKRKDFIRVMKEVGVDLEDATALWAFLCDEEIVVDEVVEKEIPPSLQFPKNLQHHKEAVCKLIYEILHASVTQGVGDATVGGLITGGVMGGVSAGAEIHQQKKMARQQRKNMQMQKRGQQPRGRLLGGGKDMGRKVNITPSDKAKALNDNAARGGSAKRALQSLEGLSTKKLHQMGHNVGDRGSAKEGPHSIHALGRSLDGCVALDVEPHGANRQRSSARMIFERTNSSKLEYNTTIPGHDYSSVSKRRKSYK